MKLKPCPFCRSRDNLSLGDVGGKPSVICLACECGPMSLEKWNTRAPDPRVEGLVAALKTVQKLFYTPLWTKETGEKTRSIVDAAIAEFEKDGANTQTSDSQRLDFLESLPRDGNVVVLRYCSAFPWRLYATEAYDGKPTVREAIDDFMKKETKNG